MRFVESHSSQVILDTYLLLYNTFQPISLNLLKELLPYSRMFYQTRGDFLFLSILSLSFSFFSFPVLLSLFSSSSFASSFSRSRRSQEKISLRNVEMEIYLIHFLFITYIITKIPFYFVFYFFNLHFCRLICY